MLEDGLLVELCGIMKGTEVKGAVYARDDCHGLPPRCERAPWERDHGKEIKCPTHWQDLDQADSNSLYMQSLHSTCRLWAQFSHALLRVS